EVKEAINTLQGKGPDDLTELCLALGSQMVVLGGKAKTIDEAKEKLNENLSNGRAFEFFKRMLESQGGDISVVDHPEQLAQSEYKIELPAKSSGPFQILLQMMWG